MQLGTLRVELEHLRAGQISRNRVLLPPAGDAGGSLQAVETGTIQKVPVVADQLSFEAIGSSLLPS
jgi:hypothetical protein